MMKRSFRTLLLALVPVLYCLALPGGALACTPCINVTETCMDASAPGEPIYFGGVVTNCGNITLWNITIVDADGGLIFQKLALDPGFSAVYSGSYIPTTSPSTFEVVATGWYYYSPSGDEPVPQSVVATATSTCEIQGGGGSEGCTPGYWKNHVEAWAPTGYTPETLFVDVFGIDLSPIGIHTLFEAVWAKGGGLNKLARHGTAALLSAAHPDVDYPITVGQVIDLVQLLESDILVEYNELGCPL